jgi:hypothetical protein
MLQGLISSQYENVAQLKLTRASSSASPTRRHCPAPTFVFDTRVVLGIRYKSASLETAKCLESTPTTRTTGVAAQTYEEQTLCGTHGCQDRDPTKDRWGI